MGKRKAKRGERAQVEMFEHAVAARARRELVFAYGSNMDGVQMRGRCPGAQEAGSGVLVGWALVFCGFSRGWGGELAWIWAFGAMPEGARPIGDSWRAWRLRMEAARLLDRRALMHAAIDGDADAQAVMMEEIEALDAAYAGCSGARTAHGNKGRGAIDRALALSGCAPNAAELGSHYQRNALQRRNGR